jgi:phosphopantetheinyl transferase
MGIMKIDETWQEMLAAFENADLYCAELDKIKSDSRKQEWLAVRLLLKYLLREEQIVDYDENGAPSLRNRRYRVSFSHTKGFAAVILGEYEALGVDIEYHSERAWRLRERFLSTDELKMFALLGAGCEISESPESPELRCFDLATVCWCAKETAFKALLQTEVDFIRHLRIYPFVLSDKGTIRLRETKTPLLRTYIINYMIAENYIITWKE